MVVKAFATLLILFLCGRGAAEKLLADMECENVRIVRHRLEEEKEKRLLLENDVEILMLKVAKLERALSSVVKVDEEISPEKTSPVAFHASYSKSHISLKTGNILVFDRVLSNQGNGYSASSGTFRAPVEGTYYFSLHLLASGSKTLHNGIYKNGDIMGYTYAAGTGSQSVVIDLKVGDEVFVKAYVDGVVHGGHYCAFSGFLVA